MHLPFFGGEKLAVFVSDQVPDIVVGDPGRFRQIITNIVGNSGQFRFPSSLVLALH